MKAIVILILVCLCCALLSGGAQAQEIRRPDFQDTNDIKAYCSGLVGNSMAFAFASGVSVAVPALSAGFLAASLAFAVAAVALC